MSYLIIDFRTSRNHLGRGTLIGNAKSDRRTSMYYNWIISTRLYNYRHATDDSSSKGTQGR